MAPIGLKTSRTVTALEKGEVKLWILLVGINQYQDKSLVSLRYAATDCQKLGEAILGATKLFAKKEIISHYDGAACPPSKQVILKNLEYITKTASDKDTILFYFSGHGLLDPTKEQTFLCVPETHKNDLSNTGIPLQLVLNILSHSKAPLQLVWLDCCHSGNINYSGSKGRTRQGDDPVPQMMTLLRERTAKSKGFYALLSCDEGQNSWEFPELGHGVFTYYLMRGLRGEAANSHGIIDADNLYRYIYENTINYLEQANERVRLVNQQKKLRGDFDFCAEYSLQTPKRIVEGVGELILGFEPNTSLKQIKTSLLSSGEKLPNVINQKPVTPEEKAKVAQPDFGEIASTDSVLKQSSPCALEIITTFKTKLKLTISVEEYSKIEKFLLQMIGPIGPTLLHVTLNKSKDYKELIDNLSLYLPEKQKPIFADWIESLDKEEIIYRDLEVFLKELIGPVATKLLEQKRRQCTTNEAVVEAIKPFLSKAQQMSLKQWLASSRSLSNQTSTVGVGQQIAYKEVYSRTRGEPIKSKLSDVDIKKCEEALSEFIGPMGKFLVKQALSDNSNLSFNELVESLAKHITTSGNAKKFKDVLS